MNLSSRTSYSLILTMLLASAVPSIALAHFPMPPKQPSEIGRRAVKTAVPDFTLTDQDGKPFRFAATRGKLVLITFIFTACPDVCPLLTAKFAAIQRALAEQKIKDYELLSISTDPERDRPAVLKEYASHFKADLTHWSFVTGTQADLAKVWKSLGVHVTKTVSGDVSHTTLTTLVDRRGMRRVDYYGDRWPDQEVLKDLQSLGAQK